MKKITIVLLLFILSIATFSQQTDPPPSLTKQDYLKKSKSQRTAGWILAGTGTGLVLVAFATTDLGDIGDAINGDNSGLNRGTALFVTGGIVALSSIPLFIIASKNKRKAMSLSFKNEISTQIQRNKYVHTRIPSLNIKINL